ncbi:unnamed protein product [Peniophora sp. CBMAI 1063]|nr:unnamed protein product [Peniophora sp. CBMAI 1063]
MGQANATLPDDHRPSFESDSVWDVAELNAPVLEVISTDHSDLTHWIDALEISLCKRFKNYTVEGGVFEKRILQTCHDLKSCFHDHVVASRLLDDLAQNLHDRFEAVHRPACDPGDAYDTWAATDDLNDAVEAKHRAVAFTPPSGPTTLSRMWSLGRFLYSRSIHLRGHQDIENVVQIARWSLDLSPDWAPDMATRLAMLGASLHIRFKRLGVLQDVEDSISATRQALKRTHESHPERSSHQRNFAIALHTRFLRLGVVSDLEDAILEMRRALQLCFNHHSDVPDLLETLGTLLHCRYMHMGKLEDLESSISLHRRAMIMTPRYHTDMVTRLGSLAISLHSRFQTLDDPQDIEDAISFIEDANELVPSPDHPERPIRLDSDGLFKQSRYARFGNLWDIEAAMDAKNLANSYTREGHPDKPMRLMSLGISLQARFEHLGEIEDLQDAIFKKNRAVELTPDGHIHKSAWTSSLGISLTSRFRRSEDIDDLERAISLHRTAVQRTPQDHPLTPDHLENLAIALHERFLHLGELEDLKSAIDLKRRAVDLTPEGHFKKAIRLNSLAMSLGRHFMLSHTFGDLQESISVNRRALVLAPDNHPIRSAILFDLGLSREQLFKLTHDPSTIAEAEAAYKASALHSFGAPSSRLRSAIHWAETARKYSSNSLPIEAPLLTAHACIMNTLREVVWPGYGIRRRFEKSAEFGALTGVAVSTALSAGALLEALEWLERGRTLIWSEAASWRRPLTELAMQHPDDADFLKLILRDLRYFGFSHNVPNIPIGKAERTGREPGLSDSDYIRPTYVEYEDKVKEIRSLPGFKDFMIPSTSKELVARFSAQATGSVVFLNIHASRCDAITLTPDGALRLVELPDLTLRYATSLRRMWVDSLRARGVRLQRGDRATAHVQDEGDGLNDSERVLRYLWLWVVHPVLQALNLMKTDINVPLPHITWCPTGPLTQLPLHAAGIYTKGAPRVFDFVVSSYTPSLSALQRCRDGMRAPSEVPKVLLVTQANTPRPGLSPLPCVKNETAAICRHLPSGEEHAIMEREQATERGVLSLIGNYTWVHFACHGSQNKRDPSRSAFELHDGPLTLSALMTAVTDNAEMAFLSACQTAMGDESIAEESMHLAAGMLTLGFKAVVATMWSINDADAPVVVEAYYRRLIELRSHGEVGRGQTGAAYALHEAVARLREKVGEGRFERWVPFVHFGV